MRLLVGAVGIEPTTFGLKVCLSLFPLFGINDLHSHYSVELPLFGLFWGCLPYFFRTDLHRSRVADFS
jgi:hypothetical protein